MSGRRSPESAPTVACTSKSTRLRRPAVSTRVRSWVSPHAPRTELFLSTDAKVSAAFLDSSTDRWVWRIWVGELGVLGDPGLLQVVDLALHRPEVLDHGGQGLEHLGLAGLATLPLLLLRTVVC